MSGGVRVPEGRQQVSRTRHNLSLFLRFGMVGASGVLVNLIVVYLVAAIAPDAEHVFVDLPLTDFNIRWYHVISTIAFFVANAWNFLLNRRWAFKSGEHASWLSEYLPFLAVGLVVQVLGLGLLTLLMHPGSWFSLSPAFFDDSSILRNRLVWAQVIVLALVTPASFVLNKLWVFRSVRSRNLAQHS